MPCSLVKTAYVLSFKWLMCLHPLETDIWISKEIVEKGAFEGPSVQNMLTKMSQWSDTVLIDIGANIGMYTLAAAAAGFTTYTFEPVPKNMALLEQSVEINRFNSVHMFPVGLHNKTTMLLMGKNVDNQGGIGHWQSEHMNSEKSDLHLPAMSLDRVLHNVIPEKRHVYIKMDIEGGECTATKGMKRYLSGADKIIGVTMEYGQSQGCCTEWKARGGFFHVLHHKHNLCPDEIPYPDLCSKKSWDLHWNPCT